jgi:hypothetical protein
MLDYIKEALSFNWGMVIIGIILAVLIFKGVCELWDWFFRRFGIETKSMKERRETKEQLKTTTDLAKTTAENLDKLETRHTKDEKEFRERLDNYIDGGQEDREKINSLIEAQKEMLAEKINEKYKYYLSIKGIPEDEYDEFVSLHTAYKGVGGNHHGDAKFNYCIEHLPIIPVETKLVYDIEE